MTYMVMNIYN